MAQEPDLTAWLVKRAHRRYGLMEEDADVAAAWTDIGASGYSHDGATSLTFRENFAHPLFAFLFTVCSIFLSRCSL